MMLMYVFVISCLCPYSRMRSEGFLTIVWRSLNLCSYRSRHASSRARRAQVVDSVALGNALTGDFCGSNVAHVPALSGIAAHSDAKRCFESVSKCMPSGRRSTFCLSVCCLVALLQACSVIWYFLALQNSQKFAFPGLDACPTLAETRLAQGCSCKSVSYLGCCCWFLTVCIVHLKSHFETALTS